MKKSALRYNALILILCLVVLPLVKCQSPDATNRAEAIADTVIENMGGREGWDDTPFLAWTFRDQYQVWDKKGDRFRWEKDSLVAIINTATKEGNVYIAGQEVTDQAQKQEITERVYAAWINNAYWLVMPFKLRDAGVHLAYIGEDKTATGAAADKLKMTFDRVGLTPQNKYNLWVDKQTGLVTQWAYFSSATDSIPGFTRRWSDYKDYGSIKLASNRSNPESEFILTHIATPAAVPDAVFNSPTPIDKL